MLIYFERRLGSPGAPFAYCRYHGYRYNVLRWEPRYINSASRIDVASSTGQR